MQHEVKTVKATTKKYKTKDGVKESISKRIDLGVDSGFTVGDDVVILKLFDFDKLNDNSADDIADRDATIVKLNDSVDKYKSEVDAKTNKIGDLSKEIKALKTKVVELESDISAKDDIIDGLEKEVAAKDEIIADSGKTIGGLNDKVDELTATVGELKPLLLTKDATITDLEKQIAVYDAIDISNLKDKAKELDKTKNVIILQQKQITEYIQLVNFHKETATAYKNQNAISKLFGRDAAAEITAPDLALIDSSGNPIKDDNVDADNDDSGNTTKGNIKKI